MAYHARLSGWIALGLSLSFAVASFILIGIEPRMGFTSIGDFFDPLLVVPALASTAWLISDLSHIVNGCLVIVLSNVLVAKDGVVAGRLLHATGMISGALFLLVAMLDRVAAELPALVHDTDSLSVITITFVATRMGALLAALFALGGFVCSASFVAQREQWYPRWFSYAGFLVGFAACVFWWVPTPIPVLLCAWTAGFAFFRLTDD